MLVYYEGDALSAFCFAWTKRGGGGGGGAKGFRHVAELRCLAKSFDLNHITNDYGGSHRTDALPSVFVTLI